MDGHVHYFSTPPTRTQSVTLGDEEARRRGVQKSVLERAAPPTFDVCVEMIERGKWRVHLDVAQARWREEGREGAVGRGTGKREGGREGGGRKWRMRLDVLLAGRQLMACLCPPHAAPPLLFPRRWMRFWQAGSRGASCARRPATARFRRRRSCRSGPA